MGSEIWGFSLVACPLYRVSTRGAGDCQVRDPQQTWRRPRRTSAGRQSYEPMTSNLLTFEK